MKTLYVSRPLAGISARVLYEWAKENGLPSIPPEDMHVTIALSKSKVEWETLGEPDKRVLKNPSYIDRELKILGEKALVLGFFSDVLSNRWKQFIDGGCSWDYESYQPHVTVSYDTSEVPKGLILPELDLIFEGEVWTEVVEDWEKNVKET